MWQAVPSLYVFDINLHLLSCLLQISRTGAIAQHRRGQTPAPGPDARPATGARRPPRSPRSGEHPNSSSNSSSKRFERFLDVRFFYWQTCNLYGKLGIAFTKPVLILCSICPVQRHFLVTYATSFFFIFHILPSIDALLMRLSDQNIMAPRLFLASRPGPLI